MAGASIRIDIDDREVKHALERLLRRTGDLSDPMREIAEVLLGSTRGGYLQTALHLRRSLLNTNGARAYPRGRGGTVLKWGRTISLDVLRCA